jgi:hypothetical protein
MAILATFDKQPIEVQDYDISFVNWLLALADSAETVTGSASAGINLISTEIDPDGVVKVWVSGGTDGQSYTIVVVVTTLGGRVKQAEIVIKVKDK